MPTQDRMKMAEKILKAYSKAKPREYGPDEDMHIVLRDLLTDLAHYCEAEGIDLDERMGSAMEVFEEERAFEEESADA